MYMFYGGSPREFFRRIVAQFRQLEVPRVKIITVCHCQSYLEDYLIGISEIGDITRVILKASHRNQQVEDAVRRSYPIADDDVTKDWLYDQRNARRFLEEATEDSQFLIFDIGGYFANALPMISRHFTDTCLGIVEDTENGHQKYQRMMRRMSVPIPVVSVARSRLKATEDHRVGTSVLVGADRILRQEFSETIYNLRVGVLGLGKIGRSVLSHCNDLKLPAIGYDLQAMIRMEVASQCLAVVHDVNDVFQADFIVSATGNRAIGIRQLDRMNDFVVIGSVTSADDELMFADFVEHFEAEQISEHIWRYHRRSPEREQTVFLLCNGNAVNFANGQAVVSPFLFGVQSAMIVSGIKLLQNDQFLSDIDGFAVLSNQEEEALAQSWCEFFGR